MRIEDPRGLEILHEFQQLAWTELGNVLKQVEESQIGAYRCVVKKARLGRKPFIEIALKASHPGSFTLWVKLFQDGLEFDLEDIPYDGCYGYDSLQESGRSQTDYLKERMAVLADIFSWKIKVVERRSHALGWSWVYQRKISAISVKGSWEDYGMTTGMLFSNPFGNSTQVERFCQLH